ncbi:hypothetical protein VC623_22790 [Citrobacter amalonaticus]|uniref:hypothetical protein n=1 Tax=Citrobacter amalonaticus TaxID=35703 RepID=UPI00292BD104|nr:hypothetical protein [Citrobacter amalonaticus]MDV0787437.1 hypothetical protein [Citrobacter amalonaticus]MEB0643501.1 hypothetical protein [Citrobacter amalonaticus]
MPETRKRQFSLKILYDFRHLVILVLIYATEMTAWAVLNLKGLGDHDFTYWRMFLLVSVPVIVGSAGMFYKSDHAWMMYAGALAPWLCALSVIIVYGFIQMNLHFLSMDWFFSCVQISFGLQWLLFVGYLFNTTGKP